MMCPFQKTKDGHELQFGTNHLGEHALRLILHWLPFNAALLGPPRGSLLAMR